jgi:hypothetical protein
MLGTMKRIFAAAAAVATLLATSTVAGAATGRGVYVNDAPISIEQVQLLEYMYGPIQSGAYWYDPVSGLWGPQGGPAQGSIAPWLPLGGPLRADASGGRTSVFINGRELHPIDVQRLRQVFGVVPLGRYWMTADGVGGPEGGPPTFNLGASSGGSSGSGGSGSGGGYDSGPGGTWGSDGTCFYVSTDAGDVMGSGC